MTAKRAVAALPLVAAFLLTPLPALAHADNGNVARPAHGGMQQLIVQNSPEGSQMAGTIRLSYRSGGAVVRRACAIQQCVYRVPAGVVVTLRGVPHDPSRMRLAEWRVSRMALTPRVQLVRKPALRLAMTSSYTVLAEFAAHK